MLGVRAAFPPGPGQPLAGEAPPLHWGCSEAGRVNKNQKGSHVLRLD